MTSVFFIFLVLSSFKLTLQNQTYYEQKLYNDLLNYQVYDARVPPQNTTADGTLNTIITIQLEIYGVMSVNKDENTITFKASTRQYWYDERLKWNSSDYGGIDMIWVRSAMDPAQIWNPDTIIREDAGSGYFSNFKDTIIKVKSDGTHSWSRLGDLKVVTNFDYTNYPFDSQTVNITMGSMSFPDTRIKYTLDNTPLIIQNSSFWKMENVEWNFESYSTFKLPLTLNGATRTFQTFQVIIRRDGGTMLVAMIIPGCLVAALGSLYYLLPRGTGDRISYLATILLTEIMFLVMLTQFVPQCKSVPSLGYLFLLQTVILAFLTFVVLILDKIQNIRNQRKQHEIKGLEKQCNEFHINRKSAIHRKTMKYAINQETMGDELEEVDISQMLQEELDAKKVLQKKKTSSNIDRFMDILDLCFWIANITGYVLLTVINLKSIM